MCDFAEYDESKAKELAVLTTKAKELMDEIETFESIYDDCSNEPSPLKLEIIGRFLKGWRTKLNVFSYDDIYHSRCGDREGSESSLITWLSESELKQHMLEFAKKNPGNYCHHKFLYSMYQADYGIYSSDEYAHGLQGCNEISLNSIKEKDIYAAEEFAEIERKRKEELLKQQQAAEAVRLAAIEQRERAEFERLKSKFEKESSNGSR